MSIEAFIIKDTTPGIGFARSFLASPDFKVSMLREIGGTIGIPKSARRNQLFDQIADNHENKKLQKEIVRVLTERQRNWVSFKQCDTSIELTKSFSDPTELIYSVGEQNKFYGPIQTQRDPDATWLIKPVFVKHLLSEENQTVEVIIRWLTFIRIWKNTVSIHWGGFSHTTEEKRVSKQNKQFEYWNEVPNFFNDIEKMFNIQLRDIKLSRLVLHDLWEKYRRNSDFQWIDRRIRAEASGVFLNARSGGMLDIVFGNKDKGLHSMASAIWNAVEYEFQTNYNNIELPITHDFKDVILGTIIRDLGAISYEFELNENSGEKIIRGHFYFGSKPKSSSPDVFPHIFLHISQLNDLYQLSFLLTHIGEHHVDKPRQNKLI